MIEINKKYTLARRLNCIRRALMKKSYHVYFEVMTKLDSNSITLRAGGFLGENSNS